MPMQGSQLFINWDFLRNLLTQCEEKAKHTHLRNEEEVNHTYRTFLGNTLVVTGCFLQNWLNGKKLILKRRYGRWGNDCSTGPWKWACWPKEIVLGWWSGHVVDQRDCHTSTLVWLYSTCEWQTLFLYYEKWAYWPKRLSWRNEMGMLLTKEIATLPFCCKTTQLN